MSDQRTNLEGRIRRSLELRHRYYRMIGAGITPVLGKPATAPQINDFEATVGIVLPASYRAFLSICDGWKHWEGDAHLFSLDEMLVGPYADWIKRWKVEALRRGERVVANGLVIGGKLEADSGFILDLANRSPSGEAPIVNWELHEIARYSDFYNLFDRDAEDWQAIIDDEIRGSDS